MKTIIIMIATIGLFTGCAQKEEKLTSKNSFKYPTGQKYKDISYQKGFDMPYEYHH